MDKEFTQNQYYINEKLNFFFIFIIQQNYEYNMVWFL